MRIKKIGLDHGQTMRIKKNLWLRKKELVGALHPLTGTARDRVLCSKQFKMSYVCHLWDYAFLHVTQSLFDQTLSAPLILTKPHLWPCPSRARFSKNLPKSAQPELPALDSWSPNSFSCTTPRGYLLILACLQEEPVRLVQPESLLTPDDPSQ